MHSWSDPPTPHNSGNARKKTSLFYWCLPLKIINIHAANFKDASICKLSLWLNMRVECSVEVLVNTHNCSNILIFCIQLHLDWTLLTKYTTAYNQTNFVLKCIVEVLVNTQSRSTYNLHRKQNLLPSEQTSNVEHLTWRTTNKCFNKQEMGINDISEFDIQGDFLTAPLPPEFAKSWLVSNWFQKNVRVPDWPPHDRKTPNCLAKWIPFQHFPKFRGGPVQASLWGPV